MSFSSTCPHIKAPDEVLECEPGDADGLHHGQRRVVNGFIVRVLQHQINVAALPIRIHLY